MGLDPHIPRHPLVLTSLCEPPRRGAEEHAAAAGGGWTTSRHHAVPTTDLPVHAVAPLLTWFNGRMGDTLAPALAAQYGAPGGGRVRVAVHDAFIVKYHHVDAGGPVGGACGDGGGVGESFEAACARHFPALFPGPGPGPGASAAIAGAAVAPHQPTSQRHLPLHTDQSTHSLTIALNAFAAPEPSTEPAHKPSGDSAPEPSAEPAEPASEALLSPRYRGGGTYVAAWDCAVRPPAGHVLSFPGSLLHGGDPLLGGTR